VSRRALSYASVCSGIESATVAWHPLGWRPVFFAEIARFPSAVLAYHYPHVPNLGDILNYQRWNDAAFDVLVGGTPCQSFSVAGLRKGLDDPRGSLVFAYLAIAARYRPRWLVWENVPGVLSVDEGRAFGSLLGAMGQLGYGFAYRILDAQYFHLAQRRARVFVVGCLGNWRAAAAVLFERASLRGDPAPSRETGARTAGAIVARAARNGGASNQDVLGGSLIDCGPGGLDLSYALSARDAKGACSNVSQTMLVPVLADPICANEQRTYTHEGANNFRLRNVIAFDETQITHPENRSNPQPDAPSHAMPSHGRPPTIAFAAAAAVRRLTPRECERLQGFPDDYTLIPYGGRGKFAKDGPRYKALGNSKAVPVIRWIGQRIAMVDELIEECAA
jgi:DNA (cytosine-5)-methyltransferase 1